MGLLEAIPASPQLIQVAIFEIEINYIFVLTLYGLNIKVQILSGNALHYRSCMLLIVHVHDYHLASFPEKNHPFSTPYSFTFIPHVAHT